MESSPKYSWVQVYTYVVEPGVSILLRVVEPVFLFFWGLLLFSLCRPDPVGR